MQQLIDKIFAMSQDIRYVAIYHRSQLAAMSRQGTVLASSSESDKYEELIVNPTILTLIRQRGDIDCGGAQYALIRYGNFYQFVTPIRDGHASICIEPHADPLPLVGVIQSFLTKSFV